MKFLVLLLSIFVLADITKIDEEFEKAEAKVFKLHSNDFKTKTATGDWILFYGSKYCIHCKMYTPSWLEFQQWVGKQGFSSVHVAKIECTSDNDLCKDLEGFPTIKQISNGVKSDGELEREIETLKKYVTSLNQKQVTTKPPELEALDSLLKMVQSAENINPLGQVQHLTDINFSREIAQNDWLLMFHAPWCGHCIKLAPVYESVAAAMKHKLNVGKIDCTVHSTACNEFKINGYPTLYLVSGDDRIEFSGQRTLDNISKFALSVIDKPLFEKLTADQVKSKILSSDVAAFYIYDGTIDSQKHLRLLQRVTQRVKNSIKVFVCPYKEAASAFNVNGLSTPIIAVTTDNGVQKLFYSNEIRESNSDDIVNWIKNNQYSLVPEMNEANQSRITRAEYLILLAMDQENKSQLEIYNNFVKTVNEWRQRNQEKSKRVSFAWLDGIRFLKYVDKNYGIKSEDFPKLIITMPYDDVYFDADENNQNVPFDLAGLERAIDACMKGRLSVIVINKIKFVNGFAGKIVYNVKKSFLGAIQILGSTTGLFGFLFILVILIYVFFVRKNQYQAVGDLKED